MPPCYCYSRFYASIPRSADRRAREVRVDRDEPPVRGPPYSVDIPQRGSPHLGVDPHKARLRPTQQPSLDADEGGFRAKTQQVPNHSTPEPAKPVSNNLVVDGNGVSSVVRYKIWGPHGVLCFSVHFKVSV